MKKKWIDPDITVIKIENTLHGGGTVSDGGSDFQTPGS